MATLSLKCKASPRLRVIRAKGRVKEAEAGMEISVERRRRLAKELMCTLVTNHPVIIGLHIIEVFHVAGMFTHIQHRLA